MAQPVIDMHTHLGRGDSYYGRQAIWDGTSFGADDMLALMDAEGIDRVVSFGSWWEGAGRRTRPVLEALERHPGRFVGFFWADPWDPHSRADFVSSVRDFGFKGLKLHPIRDSFQASHRVVDPLVEAAGELGVPITIHSNQPGSQPALIGQLARRHPDVTIIMAHMGSAAYQDALYVAEREPNIVLETSAQPWAHRILQGAVERIGVERIVFGSDAPLHHPRVELTKIEVAGLSPEHKARILGGNALRLLDLDQD